MCITIGIITSTRNDPLLINLVDIPSKSVTGLVLGNVAHAL